MYFDFSTVAAVESPEPEPAAQELADPQQVAAVEETPTPTLTTPPPPPQQQPATENSKGTGNNAAPLLWFES